jgi:2-(1,2-epoxy-1,2-dihydrophenyl)acetyl-CoA isomerase
MPDYPHLLVETTADGVRSITLDRADKLNAVNGALAAALSSAVADAAAEDAVRVVLITGSGRAFCAGLDLSEPPTLPSSTRAERLDPYAWVGTWVRSIVSCEKPVVAAVNGAAAGAGFGLALACDVRLVAASARMTAGYVRRGLSPDAGVSWMLPRHVGLARAADILLTGRDVDAVEAERIGLAAQIVADDAFAESVRMYAAQLAAGPPVAQALTKRLLTRSLDTPLDTALRDELVYIKQCFATEDVGEAIAAFRDKRRPTFRGH